MEFRGDERAVVIQIGAVLLLAALVIAMSGYQATVVPDQNNEIEFNHNQEVQGQMQDLRAGIEDSAYDGASGSHSVALGTTFPSRALFVNPSNPSGQLRTEEIGQIEFGNVEAVNSDQEAAFWESPPSPTTGRLVYEPSYSEYDNAPTTVYEHTALYNDHPRGATTTVAAQNLINGREISITALRGDLQESTSGTVSVNRRALSRSSNVVRIERDNAANPIEITLPTNNPEYWVSSFEETDNVENVVANNGSVTVQLEERENGYALRMAQVGVGDTNGVSASPDDRAEYVVANSEQTPPVSVEVRDQFNNPVAGTQIRYEIDGSEDNTTTAENGIAEIDDAEDGDEVYAWIHDGGWGTGESYEEITIDVTAGTSAGNGSTTPPDPEPEFYVEEIVSTNDPVRKGETLKTTATIANTGGDGAKMVNLDFAPSGDPDADAKKMIEIGSGDRKDITIPFEDTDRSPGEYNITVWTDDDRSGASESVDIQEASEDALFDITGLSTNDPITEGETLEADVSVKNVGEAAGTQDVALDFDGSVVASAETTLDPDETKTVTLTYDTVPGDAGQEIPITGRSDDSQRDSTVDIEEATPNFEVTIVDVPDELGAGQDIPVSAQIENTGDGAGRQFVELYRSGRDNRVDITDSKVQLDAGETKNVTLAASTNDADAGSTVDVRAASNDDDDTGSVDVTSPTNFQVKSMDAPTEIVEGETLAVTATVENTGGPGTKTVELSIPTVGTTTTDLTLDAGESRTIELTYDTEDGDAGSSHDVYVRTEDKDQRKSLDILEDPHYDVTITETNRPTETETLEVTAEIYNTGQVEGTKDVFLDFDDRSGVDSRRVTIAADDSREVTFAYDTRDGDAGSAVPIAVRSEDATDNETVEILELARVSGTVTDRESANDDPIEGVEVELVDGDDVVVETDTTDSNGGYAFQTPRGDYTVRFDGVPVGYNEDDTEISLTEGEDTQVDARLDAYSVFATGDGNNLYNSEIDVTRTDGTTLDLSVYIDPRGGSGNYNAKTVTIDGETHTLTADAADSIRNGDRVDLLDESNYENLLNGDLDQYNGAVPQGTSYTVNDYGDVDVRVFVREKR